jgi:CubicO group peptidase (beta-lactamase class C family)
MLNTAFTEASSKGFINSMIVIRNGKIAEEKYFNGRNLFSTQTVRSVSKSFLSALVGIAVSKGILNLDQKMIDSFPEYKTAITDSHVNNITLKHLLTMRSGIKGDVEAYFTFTSSSNWIRTIIGLPLNFDPGSKSGYSTAGTHLIAGMLTKALGMSQLDFVKQNLFEPMGIEIKNWARDSQGICFGGNDMFFTTRNMAVLGLLYLNNGKINDKQIVPEDWVKNSWIYSGGSTGVWGSLTNLGYGYLWWLGKTADKNVFFALGHGGQYLMCVPDLNMIIAATSDPNLDWDISDEHERAVLKIISDYIIPAAL